MNFNNEDFLGNLFCPFKQKRMIEKQRNIKVAIISKSKQITFHVTFNEGSNYINFKHNHDPVC